MQILVIGGTNFIGPPTVRRLVGMGHEVTVFHRGETQANLPPEVKHILGDRANLSQFKDEFTRLAPQVVLDTTLYTEGAAQETMAAFKGIVERVVAISSMDVYRAYGLLLGMESGELQSLPLSEDSALRTAFYPFRQIPNPPLNAPPDYEKILVERVIMGDSELPGTLLRLPMVYGAGDPLHRFSPFLQRMDDNRPTIVLEENVAGWRGCWGSVENVADAIALVATNPKATGRIYHVAEPEALTEAERIRRIGKLAGWKGQVKIVSKDRLPTEWNVPFNVNQHWIADSTRIRQELGYREGMTVDEAFAKTIAWERSHPPQEVSPMAAPYLLDYAVEDRL